MTRLLAQLFIILSLVALVFSPAFTQNFFKGKWQEGSVDLMSGQKLSGNVKYDIGNDVVFISTDDGIKSFTASNVLTFQFIEPKKETNRTFVSIAIERSNNYKRKHFYELLEEGAVSFLERSFDTNLKRGRALQSDYATNGNNPAFSSPGHYALASIGSPHGSFAPVFLIIDERKELNMLDFRGGFLQDNKKKILDCFSKNKDELDAFLKKKNMNLKKSKNIRKLVSYYNNELSNS